MTEIFEEQEEQEELVSSEDEVLDVDDAEVEDSLSLELKEDLSSDARRRLEDLLDERRLREELDDYFQLDDMS